MVEESLRHAMTALQLTSHADALQYGEECYFLGNFFVSAW
jgi:hypothetical protein